jgi:hypothetical protein
MQIDLLKNCPVFTPFAGTFQDLFQLKTPRFLLSKRQK